MTTLRRATGVGKPLKGMKAIQRQAFFRFGEEFHSVALKAGSPLVRAYLLGQALELYLKAFLLHSGVTTAEAKDKYRHNLAKLLKAAEAAGIGTHIRVSPPLRDDIKALNDLYAKKALQYFSLTHVFSHFPSTDDRQATSLTTFISR